MAKRNASFPDVLDIQRAAYSIIGNRGSHAVEIAINRARNLGDEANEAQLTRCESAWNAAPPALSFLRADRLWELWWRISAR